MPWAAAREPCLGPCILKSVLRAKGIGCDVVHAPMRLLRYLKKETFDWIAGNWASNDFVFTREFEDQVSAGQLEVLHNLVQDSQGCLVALPWSLSSPGAKVTKLLRMRQEIVPRFLDDMMAEIDFSRYSLVDLAASSTRPSRHSRWPGASGGNIPS